MVDFLDTENLEQLVLPTDSVEGFFDKRLRIDGLCLNEEGEAEDSKQAKEAMIHGYGTD